MPAGKYYIQNTVLVRNHCNEAAIGHVEEH